MYKKIDFDFGGKRKAQKAKKLGMAKGLAAGIAAGSTIGAIGGLLFAPKSGKETRVKLADDVNQKAQKAVSDMKDVKAKASVGIKDFGAKANDFVNKKLKTKNCSCCEEANETSAEIECNDANCSEEYSNENMEDNNPKDEIL